jgi:hypothetical protein
MGCSLQRGEGKKKDLFPMERGVTVLSAGEPSFFIIGIISE